MGRVLETSLSFLIFRSSKNKTYANSSRNLNFSCIWNLYDWYGCNDSERYYGKKYMRKLLPAMQNGRIFRS